MKIVIVKVLCLLGICVLMLAGSLLPVKIIEADYEKAHRSKRVLALCNSFGGGVFLATCFNALLPAVREKVTAYLPLAYDHFNEPVPLSMLGTPVRGGTTLPSPVLREPRPPDLCPCGNGGLHLVRAACETSSETAVPCPVPQIRRASCARLPFGYR